MIDPWNPTKSELKEWAYSSDPYCPAQDFDLAVADICLSDIILESASDTQCPEQSFFLHCAYLIVGDAVRTNFLRVVIKKLMSFYLKRKKQIAHICLSFINKQWNCYLILLFSIMIIGVLEVWHMHSSKANKALKLTLDCALLSLPLQSVAVKRSLA